MKEVIKKLLDDNEDKIDKYTLSTIIEIIHKRLADEHINIFVRNLLDADEVFINSLYIKRHKRIEAGKTHIPYNSIPGITWIYDNEINDFVNSYINNLFKENVSLYYSSNPKTIIELADKIYVKSMNMNDLEKLGGYNEEICKKELEKNKKESDLIR